MPAYLYDFGDYKEIIANISWCKLIGPRSLIHFLWMMMYGWMYFCIVLVALINKYVPTSFTSTRSYILNG